MARLVAIWFALTGTVPMIVAGVSLPSLGTDVRVMDIRCEYLRNPLGIDVVQPRLSWKLHSQWRGQRQTAYQVIVASRIDLLAEERGDLWNSGKVFSDQSLDIVYAGAPLTSRLKCYWKVRVWDRNDQPGPFSEIATWEMGLLDPNDWQAQWLMATETDADTPGSIAYLRKTFVLPKWVQRARLYLCGYGSYELYLNGVKRDDSVLVSTFDRYGKRTRYTTCNVTDGLRRGFNAIGILLGNERDSVDSDSPSDRGGPILCQLEVTFIDGSKQTIISDGTWRRDSRPAIASWDSPDFLDANWSIATMGSGPQGTLEALVLPPMHAIEISQSSEPNASETDLYAFNHAGRFECSNEWLSEIQRDAVRSYLRNVQSWEPPFDLAPEMGLYNFESAAAYTAWMNDFDVTDSATELAAILVPWRLYEYDADTRILANHYDKLQQAVSNLRKQTDDAVSTACYYRAVVILSRIADLLDQTDDARDYTSLALNIRDEFNERFFNATTGLYADGTLQAQACALSYGLVPPDARERVLNNLVAMIETSDYDLDSGGPEATCVIEALADNDRSDVVYEIARHTAQTASEDEVLSPWLYRTLAGINLSVESVAFKHFIVKPQLLGDVTWVRAEHESRYGTIQSNWDLYGGTFTLKVTVPTNTTAIVYVPSDIDAFVNEGPGYIHSGDHVQFVGLDDGYVLFEVESGTYKFVSQVTR